MTKIVLAKLKNYKTITTSEWSSILVVTLAQKGIEHYCEAVFIIT